MDKNELSQNVHRAVETLEDAANILRECYEDAKGLLTKEELEEFEKLSLSVCFDVLRASRLDNQIQ